MLRLASRPMLHRSCSATPASMWPLREVRCRQLSALPPRFASSFDDQHCGRIFRPDQVQFRPLHTSNPLYARSSSFANRVKDRIQRIRQDPNLQNKVMGVGATGYGMVKLAKIGAVMKFALPALKLTKAMPLMSMGLTTVCYSCFFGVPFAVGIVSTLFASNVSRAAALKSFGCEVQPQMMVPFFGTISSGNDGTNYRKSEEYVLADRPFKRCLVILAPVAGMFAFTSAVPLMMGVSLGSQCGWAVASTGYMMGMISLVPIGEMTSGGQLLGYFSKNALLFGTGVNFALLFVLSNPILYLCFFVNLYRVYQRGFTLFGREFGGDDEAGNQTARGLTANTFSDQQKTAVAAMYWSLFLLNAGGMFLVGQSLQSPQQIRRQQFQEEQEGRARELPPTVSPPYPDDFRPSQPISTPDDVWGFGIADWAMGNLEVVEEMDRDQPMEWWEQAQQEAAASVPAHERFRSS